MPQAKRSLGLIYAVNPFGADHQSSEHDPMVEDGAADLYGPAQAAWRLTDPRPRDPGEDKVRFALRPSSFYSALDSADLCQFVWGPAWTLYGPAETVEMVKAVTGWGDFTLDEMMTVGERRAQHAARVQRARRPDARRRQAAQEILQGPAGHGPHRPGDVQPRKS